MKINYVLYSLIILTLIKADILALTLVPNIQTNLIKYDNITDGFLAKQINDYYSKNINPINLVSVGFPENFRFVDDKLYQYIDLFITTKDVAQQRDKLFSNISELADSFNKLYKQYLYQAADEAHVAHGKTIKDLDETDIQIRKENLDKFSAEINSLNTKSRRMFNEIETSLKNLNNINAPAGVLRYKESIAVVSALNKFFEKLVNKVYGTVDRLTSNGVSR